MKKDETNPMFFILLIGIALLFWWVTRQMQSPEVKNLFKPGPDYDVGQNVPKQDSDILTPAPRGPGSTTPGGRAPASTAPGSRAPASQ